MKLNEIIQTSQDEIWALLKTTTLTDSSQTYQSAYHVDDQGVVSSFIDTELEGNQWVKSNGELKVHFNQIHAGAFGVFDMHALTSLKGFPATVGSSINIYESGITSLVGISDIIKEMGDSDISPEMRCNFGNIVSGGIGIILIKGLRYIEGQFFGDHIQQPPFKIIQKYIGRPEDIFDCQAELIENGFEEFAQL